MWPPGKLLSKSGNGDCCRRFSCSGRRHAFKLGVPRPSPGLGLSLPRGTPVSSHPKEPLLWDTPLQGSYRRNKRSAQGLGMMPPRTEGNTETFQAEKRDHFLGTPRPVLSKPEQAVNWREGPTGHQPEADLCTCQPKDILRVRAICLVGEELAVPGKYVSSSSTTSCQGLGDQS